MAAFNEEMGQVFGAAPPAGMGQGPRIPHKTEEPPMRTTTSVPEALDISDVFEVATTVRRLDGWFSTGGFVVTASKVYTPSSRFGLEARATEQSQWRWALGPSGEYGAAAYVGLPSCFLISSIGLRMIAPPFCAYWQRHVVFPSLDSLMPAFAASPDLRLGFLPHSGIVLRAPSVETLARRLLALEALAALQLRAPEAPALSPAACLLEARLYT